MSAPFDPNQSPTGHQEVPASAPKKRKKWPWVVGGIIALFVIVGMAGGGDKEGDAGTAAGGVDAPAVVDAPAPASIPPLTAAAPSGKGKTIAYEVISDSATLNSVTYFDANSEMQQESNPTAPWSLTVTNPSTVVIAGVTAQTEGTSVTCRVTVDGKVKDEQTATGKYAVVNCTAPMF
ncbi:MmpS family transport accessory protein [Rhodococcus tukisamuensis]|uniref:Membrane protein n=1 Tax=Rhodococcus tukisamuensis TaxID=168276 RepID=A0A1G7BUG7_9NOCA|nr:MmpS family transport accessory protein [Rhodococcus tukisamuensis]SDE30612.1 membrane protein [Rhodococcus tukisamuensis]